MTECSICLECQTNVTLICGHSFHRNCIDEWLNKKNNCPMCRNTIKCNNPINELIEIYYKIRREEYITEFVNSFFN